jgi:hypothetical protein
MDRKTIGRWEDAGTLMNAAAILARNEKIRLENKAAFKP